MDVTDEGILTDVREEQPEKASSPMDFTDDGISIDMRDEQP